MEEATVGLADVAATLIAAMEAGVLASGFQQLFISFSHAERAGRFLPITTTRSIACWSPRPKPKT